MSTVLGTVERVIQAENGKPWKVKLAEQKEYYATFDGEVLGRMEDGMSVKLEVSSQQKGQYTNWYLTDWEELNSPDAPTPTATDDTVSDDVWLAKDRRIAMQSAYKASASALRALPSEKVSAAVLRDTAHMIYHDIVAAGEAAI
jgi:hypothetical protein